jgi:hypothetical protein
MSRGETQPLIQKPDGPEVLLSPSRKRILVLTTLVTTFLGTLDLTSE